ncbi:LMBR1-like membrane protein [Dillenia turbinata]|uniref:LMBR1-like membrane protein n=1 Tax=Dillenia turbinata TaxID=194707 RepID=A0AAN8Z7W2_9MAGN
MWVFYLISLPLTLGMVFFTLRYFAGPHVPHYVLFIVGYAWFCSLSIIILVPADIWTTLINHENWGISFFWSWSYWSTAVVPLIQGFEDAGDFTVGGNVVGLAMACSNTFGLVTGAFLLGFGLSEIPTSMWKNADWTTRQKVLSHKISKVAVKLDDAHREFSNAIVVAQATSKQMSKRDPLRPYMDVIDNMLAQMFREDPAFKPQGGRLGENDMDYDTDEKSMAALRRQLRKAQEEYYRYKSEYMTYVMEALELEDTIKNYERRNATGWKYVSSFRSEHAGTIGSLLDTIELIWRCILRKQLEKLLAIILGCMSVAILLAEATLLPSVDLSLFSILIKSVGREEVFVQVFAFVPLMYMCICTYYSLFKIGMLMFYSLTPRQTSSVNLLMICSMVARYAPPISYNYLNLIRLGDNKKTTFEKRMGNIDQAVPFFGSGFNKIYPLIMVIYTILVACNFFDRVIAFFGNWKRLKFQTEADDMDGFDPSGMIILLKERSWLEEGRKVGEHVIPLARNFNNVSEDIESGGNGSVQDQSIVEMKRTSGLTKESTEGGGPSKPSKDDTHKYNSSREALSNKYAAIREQSRQNSSKKQEKNITSAKVSLLDPANSQVSNSNVGQASGLASKWESMKMGFQNFKANMEARKFIPLRQVQETKLVSHVNSSESLDEIFQRLKQRTVEHVSYPDDGEDDTLEIRNLEPIR